VTTLLGGYIVISISKYFFTPITKLGKSYTI